MSVVDVKVSGGVQHCLIQANVVGIVLIKLATGLWLMGLAKSEHFVGIVELPSIGAIKTS